ncbi:caspase domain-containing protein [Sphingomonas canadensis]|uniref:Caspase domain-containing protein n=1 Tax=Sphingomonas canadensis TaxID=1219257 RepID=A0ABW3HAI6_9SPHN|nr:caspase family protein [Sphingomonas canadensis]MCW3838163.1 caspase family protein [Sphingomonas canadensis]
MARVLLNAYFPEEPLEDGKSEMKRTMGVVTRNIASEASAYDRVVVLAIAVEHYQNAPKRPAIVQVHHARADAEAFVRTIEQIYDGIADVDPHLLIDSNASLSTIRGDATYVISNLAPTDLFIFYYAGHGCQIEGENRLTAWDTNALQLGDSTIDLDQDVIAKVKASACTRALLFIDACAESMKALATSRSLIFDLSDDEIEEQLEGTDYMAVFLSCSDGEKSYGSDAIGHGIFTYHLLRALKGEDKRALERDRWMTDVSLRDWLVSEVQNFITSKTRIREKQTPRAILHSPRTFRIRHVPEPPVTPAATLANLGLKNSEAFLEGVETGAIKSLPGFKRNFHTVPTDINERAANWIGSLLNDRLQEELDDLFSTAKEALGFKRREGDVSVSGGDGTVDTPAFRFWVLSDQDPDDPAAWRIRRRLELRDGWEGQREEIEEAIAGLDLDRFIVTFDKRAAAYDDVADALEDLADREGQFDERRAERKLMYRRDNMSITFDFAAGEVEFTVSGENNLELVDSTMALSLGWRSASPMLATTVPAELPDLTEETGSGAPPKIRKRPAPKR